VFLNYDFQTSDFIRTSAICIAVQAIQTLKIAPHKSLEFIIIQNNKGSTRRFRSESFFVYSDFISIFNTVKLILEYIFI